MTALNLALRFLLELVGIVALWLVGWGVSDVLVLRLLAAFGLAAALVVAWALVVAPQASNAIAPRARMLIGTALLLLAAALLAVAGHPILAGAFAALNVANTAALLALGGPEKVLHADR